MRQYNWPSFDSDMEEAMAETTNAALSTWVPDSCYKLMLLKML